MNWSDYEAVWKRQEPPVGMDADVSQLRSTFESKSRKQHASILVRDYAEAGAGLIVSAAYAFFWRQIGESGWPMAIGIVLILGVSGLFLRERVRARRSRLGVDAPLLAKVEHDIAELKHQCRLLQSLWTWYLGPCALAIAIQIGVIYRRSAPWGPLRDPWVLLGFAAFFAIVLWIAWAINLHALKHRLLPRLEELEKLRRDLSPTS
jgi:hypothetical protein